MPPSPADDYYALLGVHAGADDDALRTAWRRLALQWHPDRAGDDSTALFRQIATAYAVLADPITRAAYDRRRRATEPAGAQRAAATPSTPARAARPPAPAVMLLRLSGPLPALLACGVANLDEPGVITLVLGEAEAAQGGMATISMRVELWCPDCTARGRSAACVRCGGARTVEELFSAWLAVPPGVTSGEVLVPSVELPAMVEPVRFRVRLRGARAAEA
jgi:DnaJ-class molecular chaperone